MDIKVKMQYLVQCTRTRVAPKNLSVMVRTGFALDRPSINGIGPINPSEKMKRSETVGNGQKHDQAKTCSTRISPTVSNLFPLDTFGPSKKNGVAGNAYF